ncbi:hypothetical protein CASFOL_010094 [Castilleja foliolosa]|uniref:Uncharacterized protein n=1 Tax=Castilleja foliolosa TaxID=1961234 RepID=A0ABD3CMZ0_9LAMI
MDLTSTKYFESSTLFSSHNSEPPRNDNTGDSDAVEMLAQ